jgi:hypothetical protein
MSYTLLQTAWAASSASPGALPAGVTGTSLYGLATAAKVAAVNGWTFTGAVPTTIYVTGAQVANCINWTEFAALTAAQQSDLLALLNSPGPLLSGSAQLAQLLPGMLLAYFTNHSGPTITALTALAAAAVQPWTLANGYGAGITITDAQLAGLS